MNFIGIFNGITNTINRYCIGYTNDENYTIEKQFDIESQNFIDVVIVKSKIKSNIQSISYNITQYMLNNNNNNDNDNNNVCVKIVDNSFEYTETANNDLYENLIIGQGFDRVNDLEWKRTSKYSDYEILYKGNLYKIPYNSIEKILFTTENIKKIDFESILKLYIDCGKNFELTMIHLRLWFFLSVQIFTEKGIILNIIFKIIV